MRIRFSRLVLSVACTLAVSAACGDVGVSRFGSTFVYDGDPDTFLCTHGFSRKDLEEVWVRIDLAVEREIESVTLVARGDRARLTNLQGKDSRRFPERLRVEVARDGYR